MLPKTTRYYTLIKLLNSNIFLFFLKFNLKKSLLMNNYVLPNHLNYFLSIHFSKSLWLFFKKVYLGQNLTYINNLETSLTHNFVSLNLKNMLNSPLLKPLNLSTVSTLIYSQPVQIIKFSLHKQVYNTYMMYNIMVLTQSYLTIINQFDLKYSFIFVKNTM